MDDWHQLLMPTSARVRAAPVAQKIPSQFRTAAPYLPTAALPAGQTRAPGSSAAEQKTFPSAQQPLASARGYSPSSPRFAPRRAVRKHGTAQEHPVQVATDPEVIARANLQQKLSSRTNLQKPSTTTATEPHESIAKAATTSPEATARAEPKPHGRVQQQTKAISSERLDSGAPTAK